MSAFVCVAQSAVKRTFIQSAVRKCGGDQKKGEQLYTAYGSTGQVSSGYLSGNVTLSQQIKYTVLGCCIIFHLQSSVGLSALLSNVEVDDATTKDSDSKEILFMVIYVMYSLVS